MYQVKLLTSNNLGSPMSCEGFFKRRERIFKRKLSRLRRMSDWNLASLLSDSLTWHHGKCIWGINWEKVDRFFVMSVGWSIGGKRLAIILEEMLRDPVCFCRGMPDLLFCHAIPSCVAFGCKGCQCCNPDHFWGSDCENSTKKIFVSEVKRLVNIISKQCGFTCCFVLQQHE